MKRYKEGYIIGVTLSGRVADADRKKKSEDRQKDGYEG